ncbi:MAG: Unknown protein [uncultured Thiotrichaceae bacterium]|uniref:Uncharacterized protein n=1 Tax=uncultured Thiotrichaceae bacterium TaxID=298394 RepID=A0A6S6T5G4_9GAMM|nr:MAG: Unknown protein [uncultured Thiotrichaceae bacterium]
MSETLLNHEKLTHDEVIEGEMQSFENRWRYAVFPAMVAFVILAVFGFYLIYGMLQRMEALSQDVHRMTNILEKTLPPMSDDMQEMNETISHNIPAMKEGVSEMSISTHNIAATTGNMSNSVWEMNRSVSKPLSMMNTMMPFGSRTNLPRPTYTRPVLLKVPKTMNKTPVMTTEMQPQAAAPVVPVSYQQPYQVQPRNPAPVNNYPLRYD